MAAITKVQPAFIAPPGMEVTDKGYAKTDIAAGDPIVIVADTPRSTRWEKVVQKATSSTAHGIAVKTVKAGGNAEWAAEGEMDGFAGLTPGNPLSVVSGAIDDTAPTISIDDGDTISFTIPDPHPAIRAVTPSRIYFSLV